MTVYKKK